MKALILAAGYATRLYPLTIDTPKALLNIRNKPILDYILDEIDTIDDINEIVIISNARFYDNFSDWAKARRMVTAKQITVLNDGTTNDSNKLGAIGDIYFAIDSLSIEEDVVIIAGDNLFNYKLKDSYDEFIRCGRDMILGRQMDSIIDLQRMAVGILDASNLVVDMEEKPKNPKSDIAFFATYYYRKETLPMIREYLDEGNNPDAPGNFPAWLYVRKPLQAFIFDGDCVDIGTPESYEEVKNNWGNM